MPESVQVSPLVDATLERVGFPLDHPYIERVYCSILGPTSVLLLRRFGELLADQPQGVSVDLVDLSRSLGVGPRVPDGPLGRNAPIRRSMERLVQFQMASWLGDDRLGVHTKVPAVSRHRAEKLVEPVQALHRHLLTDHLSTLVATAEGKAPAAPTERPAAGIPPQSAVAERLKSFGETGHDLRSVAR